MISLMFHKHNIIKVNIGIFYVPYNIFNVSHYFLNVPDAILNDNDYQAITKLVFWMSKQGICPNPQHLQGPIAVGF